MTDALLVACLLANVATLAVLLHRQGAAPVGGTHQHVHFEFWQDGCDRDQDDVDWWKDGGPAPGDPDDEED